MFCSIRLTTVVRKGSAGAITPPAIRICEFPSGLAARSCPFSAAPDFESHLDGGVEVVMNAIGLRKIWGPVLAGLLQCIPGLVADVSGIEAVRTRAGDDGSRVEVELFVMAHCPYGMRAETALAPTVRAFGDGIDFRLHFIAQEAGKEPVPAGPLRPLRSRGEACESARRIRNGSIPESAWRRRSGGGNQAGRDDAFVSRPIL